MARSSEARTGLILMLVASLCFSTMTLFVKLAGDVGTSMTVAFRFLFGLLVLFGLVSAGWIRIRVVNRTLWVLRGVFGGAAVILYFLAINKIGMAEGSVLSFTFPIFAAVFAFVFLGDRVGIGGWLSIFVGFVGACLIVSPENWSGASQYKLLALLGALLAGLSVVIIKRLHRTDSSYAIFFSQCLFGYIAVCWPAGRELRPLVPVLWFYLIGVGVMATTGQLLMTYSYKLISATHGSLLSFLTPVCNVVLGALIFAERMSTHSLLGSVLVIGACIYVSVSATRAQPGERSQERRSQA